VNALKGGAVALGLGVAAWFAYGEAQRRSHAGNVAREARVELVRFAGGIAKCSTQQPLPETSRRVPLSLSEVSAKTYTSRPEEWNDDAFECAGFRIGAPQYMQYRWSRDGDGKGRVEARADSNGDGAPDTWFEVPVSCETRAHCEVPNYPIEVSEDGERLPPLLLRMVGQASAYRGEPPSSVGGGAVSSRGPAISQAPPPPPPSILRGVAVALDVLFVEAERRAATKLPGAVLLELELLDVQQPLADPAQHTRLVSRFGVPDVKGRVPSGAEVVSVTFDAEGMTEKVDKANTDLRRLGTIDCPPEKLFRAAAMPPPLSMALSWDTERNRALWRVKSGISAAERLLSAESCAIVK
jgi:hypothetical protein